MALRLVKIRLPEEERSAVLQMTEELATLETWTTRTGEGSVEVEFLVDLEQSEPLIDTLESRFGADDNFRVIVEDVEATLPRPEEDTDGETEGSGGEGSDQKSDPAAPPIGIDELYDDVAGGMAVDGTYTVMVLLSTVVAAVGLVRDDVAMVIAAMIIAPLLRPNIALSLATTLADRKLAWRALLVNGYGLTLSAAVAIGFGWLLPFDETVPQIALRTQFGLLEFMLAASAGAAGAMSYTTGEADKVVGVMVAVALLPPLVVFGMLTGAGLWQGALGALLLTTANVVCLNLAGVVTFLCQRVRPRNAWDSERAKTATWVALAVWILLLGVLVAIVVFAGDFRRYP